MNFLLDVRAQHDTDDKYHECAVCLSKASICVIGAKGIRRLTVEAPPNQTVRKNMLATACVVYVPEYMIASASRNSLLGPLFSIPLVAIQSSYPPGLVICIGTRLRREA